MRKRKLRTVPGSLPVGWLKNVETMVDILDPFLWHFLQDISD